jgi:bidirectional [NiFe] hydrogenase diaphorase subunit
MNLQQLIDLGEAERAARKPVVIRVCVAAGCTSSRSPEIVERLREAVEQAGLQNHIHIAPVGCMRLCCRGPLVGVEPAGKLYQEVAPEDATDILGTLSGDQWSDAGHDAYSQITAKWQAQSPPAECDQSAPFFSRQASVVLENSGLVEPERIATYLAAEGYQGLHRAVFEMRPGEVIDQVTRSGLRGRGGAGYPAGVKWSLVAKTAADQRFVVCNADEGDPGAFMNRSVLESDPHRVLEGMAIAGYAVGANQGYIYVRGEYPLAIDRLKIAIQQATKLNMLGAGIFGSPFDFRIDLRIGGGAFVCGEETALMHSIMGERGIPSPRPPYPAEHGLWGMPTLLNNVETYANVPAIVRRGAEWFAGIGTASSTGTKVFCLTGQIKNAGLVEVPLGTSLRTIVEEIGGGVPGDGSIKAVQTGGPSGGCIPASLFDTPVDYDSLARIGSIMGSGGMIVLDETADMVDIARYFMQFCMSESCGKCVPCRAGTVQLHSLLHRILDKQGRAEDLQQLETLCDLVQQTSLCGLGQTAPNPTLSTLRYFRQEYESKLMPASKAITDSTVTE